MDSREYCLNCQEYAKGAHNLNHKFISAIEYTQYVCEGLAKYKETIKLSNTTQGNIKSFI